MTLNSNTYDAVDLRHPPRGGEADRRSAVGSRYPHSPLPASAHADRHGEFRHEQASHQATSDRARAALLITFAVIALSAFAAIGWLQYQAQGERSDPQFEVSAPPPSAPVRVGGRS